MKKGYLLLLLFIFLTNINVDAQGTLVPMSNKVTETIEHRIGIHGELEEVILKYSIDEDCSDERLTITPDIFYSIGNYSFLKPNQKVKITIKIENLSNYDYGYVDHSLIISTDDITRLGTKSNFLSTNAIGFDGKPIYEMFYPYRVKNSAIEALLQYDSEFVEGKIDRYLKDLGYQGVSELDQYYLDFYNEKYHLNEMSLEDFTDSVKKEILEGELTYIKENNRKFIELAYNFFYNKVLLLDINNNIYSIGDSMRDGVDNSYFKAMFDQISSKTEHYVDQIYLGSNPHYLVDNFKYYTISGYMGFELEQIKSTNEYIIPPNTGVN